MIELKLEIFKNDILKGTIPISGSKNATLALMACSLLTNDTITLDNVPNIVDVLKLSDILKHIGVFVKYDVNKNQMILKRKTIRPNLNIKEIHEIRASYYIMGTLVGLGYSFKALYPGGCSFAKRPIDYHLDAFKAVGYKIIESNGIIILSKKKRIKKDLNFKMIQKSVGTTINILFISVLRKGKTIITNASLEPEVFEVIKMLKQMGADIKIISKNEIEINGVKKLKGTDYRIIADRIEAGSYMLLAAAVPKSNLILENIYLPHLKEVIKTVQNLGVEVIIKDDKLIINKELPIKGINQIASTYPHFPTDLQQILCATLTQAITSSTIVDDIYPNRISHLKEIEKCGGAVQYKENLIHIQPANLYGNILCAHDLRCGFACIVLGAVAFNSTIVENAEVVLRGYENLIDKLQTIGLKIKEL